MPERSHFSPDMNSVLAKNIHALVDQRKQEDAGRGLQHRAAKLISDFAGSMSFVYLHLAVLAVWIGWNIGFIDGLNAWDPTFVILAMAASVEAIFLSTFVLITQNRMASVNERRAELDLQISLLNEHETTRIIEMLAALATKLNLQTPVDAELTQLSENVDPARVIEEIGRAERNG